MLHSNCAVPIHSRTLRTMYAAIERSRSSRIPSDPPTRKGQHMAHVTAIHGRDNTRHAHPYLRRSGPDPLHHARVRPAGTTFHFRRAGWTTGQSWSFDTGEIELAIVNLTGTYSVTLQPRRVVRHRRTRAPYLTAPPMRSICHGTPSSPSPPTRAASLPSPGCPPTRTTIPG